MAATIVMIAAALRSRWPLLVALLASAGGGHAGAQVPSPLPASVWLDLDTAMGPLTDRPRDVDDGLTLIQALATRELRVAGISVVFGNAPLAEALANTQHIVERFAAPSILVHAGAASDAELGKNTAAVVALTAALRREPLTILALGPVTNVATVVSRHPELRPRIRSIVLVAARRPGFDFHPAGRPDLKFPDANFEKDVKGMQILLDSDIPLVFAGYEASSDVWLTRAHLDAIGASGVNGAWIREMSLGWLSRFETTLKLPGFNPFDTLAVGWMARPAWFTAIPVRTHITSGPDDRLGTGPAAGRPSKPYLVCEPTDDAASPHRYLTAAKDAFVPWLVERLSAR